MTKDKYKCPSCEGDEDEVKRLLEKIENKRKPRTSDR
jgi:hypothetical protein